MVGGPVGAVIWVIVIVVVAILFARRRRRGGSHFGPGTAGAMYGLLNEDKQNAIEVIVEERAAYKDPEDRDGNLPDLEKPGR